MPDCKHKNQHMPVGVPWKDDLCGKLNKYHIVKIYRTDSNGCVCQDYVW